MKAEKLDEIIARLRQDHIKITDPRREIIELIFEHQDHIDADQIVRILKNRGSAVSRATVYRTLDLLVDKKLVNKMDFGDGRSVYEFRLGQPHHDHMKCIRCGRIIEFNDHIIELRQNTICQNYKFHPSSHVMQIYGLCSSCYEKEKS